MNKTKRHIDYYGAASECVCGDGSGRECKATLGHWKQLDPRFLNRTFVWDTRENE